MKKTIQHCMFALALILPSGYAAAGAGGELTLAPQHEQQLRQISMLEADQFVGKDDVQFYDVNTLELWAEGAIPGAVFFNVKNWKELLPKNKDAKMVFYCANRLCTVSNMAAREVMKLGYTNVMQMPDGIYGWRMSGRPTEKL
ncbi:rhodanese-like domain-containing protein [Shewanella marina]|uniref:rhodanese-like domain-containing protein n=1 Tax=Shewanella marina TaxID=487319 RepID=UPI0004712B58|nr:rhodanese-like domain-containing protein [Shewanella marina]